MKLEYVLQQAVIDFDADMEPDVRAALERAKALVEAGREEDALRLMPPFTFSFDPASCEEPPEDYLESLDAVVVPLDDSNSTLELAVDGDNLTFSLTVSFELDTLEDIEPEDFESWLAGNGGWFACDAVSSFSYTPEDSGELTCLA